MLQSLHGPAWRAVVQRVGQFVKYFWWGACHPGRLTSEATYESVSPKERLLRPFCFIWIRLSTTIAVSSWRLSFCSAHRDHNQTGMSGTPSVAVASRSNSG